MQMQEATNALIAASLAWWKSRRPQGWTQERHLGRPAVNMPTVRDAELALAVAEYIRTAKALGATVDDGRVPEEGQG